MLKVISVTKPLVRPETKKEKPENLMIYWLFLVEKERFGFGAKYARRYLRSGLRISRRAKTRGFAVWCAHRADGDALRISSFEDK